MEHRIPTNDDLWAAVRGLGMYGMTRAELLTLAYEHEQVLSRNRNSFGSKVIAAAARQVASTKPTCEDDCPPLWRVVPT